MAVAHAPAVSGRTQRPGQLRPGPGLPRASVARHQRERLLAAVADFSLEFGLQPATVAQIAAHAGVSKHTFYEHFNSKGDLFLAAYGRATAQMRGAVNRAFVAVEGEWPARIVGALHALLVFLAADAARAHLCIADAYLARRPAGRDHDGPLDFLGEYLELAPARPTAPAPPLTAQIVIGGVHEVLHSHILDGRTVELPALLPGLAYGTLAPYLGVEATRKELIR
jgi:AcrR family transcriptional regulator